MIKYFGKFLIGTLLMIGIYTHSFTTISNVNTSKIYYDSFKYTNNVILHKVNGLEVDYSASLNNVGDSYQITFDVINKSGYDVQLCELCCPLGDEYIKYLFTYEDGNTISEGDILKNGESKRFKYMVFYENLITEDNYTFDSSFSIRYDQKI